MVSFMLLVRVLKALYCPRGIIFTVALWRSDGDQENLLDWKEFENLVLMLEKQTFESNLNDAIVFLYTENYLVIRSFLI